MAKGKAKKSWKRRILKCGVICVFLLLLVPVGEVVCVRFFNPPATMPMMLHRLGGVFSKAAGTKVQYEYTGLNGIPVMFIKHLWISEDERFFQHNGFDWKEMDAAIKKAEREGKPVRGASTITNQCARSLFLWQGRSWIRKGLEAYYTVVMELIMSKPRIMELYANVIEMGDGIYGVEAAAKHYYGVSPRGLTRDQSAMLAAVLPNPTGWNPNAPGPTLLRRQRSILERAKTTKFPVGLLEGN